MATSPQHARTSTSPRRRCAALPHRERYLRLVHAYGRALLDMHEDWLDEAERELGAAS